MKRFQFSLRTFLIAFSALCAFLGWLSVRLYRAEHQARVVRPIRFAGGDVGYDWLPGLWADVRDSEAEVSSGERIGRGLFGNYLYGRVRSVTFFNRVNREALAELSNLDSLRILTFADVPFRPGDAQHLALPASLREVQLFYRPGVRLNSTVVDKIANIRELGRLSLAGDQIESAALDRLLSNGAITHLSLMSMTLNSSSMRQMARLPRLRELQFDGCGTEGVAFDAELSLPHVRWLKIVDSPNMERLLGKKFCRMPALEWLHLRRTTVTPTLIEDVASRRTLRRLFLYKCPNSQALVAAIREKLPQCEVIAAE